MNITGKMISLLGASCLVALAGAAPAEARAKPCCYSQDGQFSNVTPSTCYKYGGRVVAQEYCSRNYQGDYRGDYRRDYDGRPPAVTFSIILGDVMFGYSDGYYDRQRRWHRWRNNNERNWYRQNRRGSYHDMQRDRDRDQNRRDWREGRRNDWRADRSH